MRGISFRSSITAVLLVNAQLAAGQAPDYPLAAVDVYGTELFDGQYVRSRFAMPLNRLVEALVLVDTDLERQVSESIADDLRELGDFAFVSVIGVPYSPEDGVYVTVDVVEEEDADRRMPFRDVPDSMSYEDPDGLLGKWAEYFDQFRRISRAGELQGGREPCEVLHCLGPFLPNPELAPYLEIFNEGARKHEEVLYEIALSDVDAAHRETAIYLLGHTDDVHRLMPVLTQAMYDPDWRVRNNAMRLMLYMRMSDPDLPVPVEALLDAMDFPTIADRNKSMSIVWFVAQSHTHDELILGRAVPIALRLLRLDQPNNHFIAYELLKTVSGEDFGELNYVGWEDWFGGLYTSAEAAR